jgi:hypothetical protein
VSQGHRPIPPLAAIRAEGNTTHVNSSGIPGEGPTLSSAVETASGDSTLRGFSFGVIHNISQRVLI